MRVPDSLFYLRNQSSLARTRSRLAKAQDMASSGQRVTKPSDDPLASAQARRETARERQAEGHQGAISSALAALNVADDALAQVTDALVRTRELAVQHANDTIGAPERAMAASEVAALRDQVLSLANTEMGGRYLFAGYRDGARPYDAAGAYSGDSNTLQVQAAPGVLLDKGLPGDQIFAPAGGVDIFAALSAFETGLRNNDETLIQSAIDDMNAGHGQVVLARGDLGAQMQGFDIALAVAERTQHDAITERSRLVEADALETFAELAQAEYALQSAVEIASRLPPPGLLGRG